ncbi:MAG: cytochrome C [Verrucomicrobia bacterium]|nr:cytochrome C [Verrucomicrobiota bacterium]
MPIYEFYCPDNHRIYSFYARSSALRDNIPLCPDDPSLSMERRLSSFAVTGKAKEETDTPAADFDDPRMEAAMAEMEREMAGMDEDNPDPKRLAHMMRKMSALTGEKLPAEMEEMMRRMELGEDPEKLEEEYGDLLGEDEDGRGAMGDDAMASPAHDDLKTSARLLRSFNRPPRRDPHLYEMSDYLPS